MVGAIFAAETFKMPNAFWCYLYALGWSEDDAKKFESIAKDTAMDHPYQRRKWGTYDEELEDIDWMPDRTIMHGNTMINLWYGKRKGKYVVVKKEVCHWIRRVMSHAAMTCRNLTYGYRTGRLSQASLL